MPRAKPAPRPLAPVLRLIPATASGESPDPAGPDQPLTLMLGPSWVRVLDSVAKARSTTREQVALDALRSWAWMAVSVGVDGAP